MKPALVMLLAIAAAAPLLRETNSHAAASRGAKAYQSSRYSEAVTAYARAQQLAPSPRNAFNLGTAQIAAGDRERGSATLGEAMKDPAVRAEALFNRGNSALAAKSFEHAVRDYIDALRLRPDHAPAKRNLEIALTRQQQAQRSGASGRNQQAGQQNQQKQQSQQGQSEQKPGEVDLEALLRSVQQQEQEELRRMKARPAEAKVGW